MSKLLKFRECVTISETAKHLTKMLGEEVTVGDVEELVDHGHLVASVSANGWACYFPEVAIKDEVKIWKHRFDGRPDDILTGIYPIDACEAFPTEEHEAAHDYLRLTLSDGRVAFCYEIVDPGPREISRESVGLPPLPENVSVLESVRSSFEILAAWEEQPIPIELHKRPSTKVEDLVIRTSDLLGFVAKANDEALDKPMDYRERESMERIILTLAKEAGYDLKEPFKAASALQAAAARVRVELPKSKDTIAGKLKAAACHDIHD